MTENKNKLSKEKNSSKAVNIDNSNEIIYLGKAMKELEKNKDEFKFESKENKVIDNLPLIDCERIVQTYSNIHGPNINLTLAGLE